MLAGYPLAAVTLPFLAEVVALLVACVLIAYVCYRLRLEAIVGFLLAGVLIGPTALGLVTDRELIDAMAEVGVILLLFLIGIEFSLEKLARIQRAIFAGGGLQVGLTVAVVAGFVIALGTAWPVAVFTGCLVALSSTAIVLKLLANRNETDTPMGRFALAILIFQDLIIVVMVLLVPVLGGTGGTAGAILWALGKAGLVIGVVLLGARRLLPLLLERIARTRQQELFLLAIVTLCLGTAWLTSLAGVSLALGAFLAGLMVSESRYSTHAFSQIVPLGILFNAVFFVSIGMLLDVGFFLENLGLVLAVAAAVLVVKAVLAAVSVRLLGYPIRIAAAVGLTLAQIGEFSFVLARAGEGAGLTPAGLGEAGMQTFIAVTVLLMILTPFLAQAGPWVGAQLTRWSKDEGGAAAEVVPTVELEDHVLLVGYGPAGQRLGRALHECGLPCEVIELNPRLIAAAEADGLPVLRGDAAQAPLLEHAGIARAKLVVVAINDEAATARIVEMAHYLNPTVQIFARTRYLDQVEPLQAAGADIVVPEELETSVRLFTHVLGAYLVPPDEIAAQVNRLREGDYGFFRGRLHEAHLMVLQGLDEEGLHTRAVAVRAGAPAAGKTLGDLGLRRQHYLTVLAIRRAGRTIGNPDGDFRIEPDDRLVLVGTAANFATAAPSSGIPLCMGYERG